MKRRACAFLQRPATVPTVGGVQKLNAGEWVTESELVATLRSQPDVVVVELTREELEFMQQTTTVMVNYYQSQLEQYGYTVVPVTDKKK